MKRGDVVQYYFPRDGYLLDSEHQKLLADERGHRGLGIVTKVHLDKIFVYWTKLKSVKTCRKNEAVIVSEFHETR